MNQKPQTIAPVTKPSDAKRPFIIALIIFLALILITSLLLLAPKIVGKAFYTAGLNTAGLQEISPSANTPFTVNVKANIGPAQTVAVGFTLKYPAGLSLAAPCEQAVLSLLPNWGNDFKTITCQDNTITFEHGTLNFDAAQTGEFDIAAISFAGAPAGNYALDFTSFDIIDLDHPETDLIADGLDTTLTITSPPAEEVPEVPPAGGGGGRRCDPQWSCSTWSICGASLTQTRTCTDLNNCLPQKTETQSCPKCQESWVCSAWSPCYNNLQTRTCYDETKCNTFALKPQTEQSCALPPPPAPPAPPPVITPPAPPAPRIEVPQPTFWDQYKTWLIATPAGLILLLIILFLSLHFFRPRVEITNFPELKSWVSQQLQKGVPKEKLRDLISHYTQWTDKELDEAFKELKQEPPPAS